MTQLSFSISNDNCQYRGEGNACLVVRLKKEEKVLRLLKEDKSTQIVTCAKDLLKQLEDHAAIVKKVLRPLLGEDLVHCPVVMPLSAEEICTINKTVFRCRPAQRCNKVVKETDTHVLMLPDYCSLPEHLSAFPTVGSVISVEIKPKQGFLKHEKLSYSHSAKTPLCSFCMRQYYKLKNGVVSKRSGYCPMDLFSGCPKRMQHAIKELINTPQNNFRIFKDQEMVYSEEKKGNFKLFLKNFFEPQFDEMYIDLLCKLVIQALLKPFSSKTLCVKDGIIMKNYPQCANISPKCSKKEIDFHELPTGCVLDRILKVQLLDNLNIDALYPLSFQLKELSQNHDYKETIGTLLRCQLPTFLGKADQVSSESKMQFASRKVWEFLLALTLKDCSLMLVFQRLDTTFDISAMEVSGQHLITDDNGNPYLFSLAITDLDSKPLSKVEKVYQDRRNVMESYLHAMNKIHQ